MLPIELLVIDSNSMDFPAGSRVSGYTNYGVLVELAGHEIENITSSTTSTSVHIHTALGYRFTVHAAEYQRVVPE
jgi:hypothetical protein